jgi:hypothetical protein
LFFRKRWFEIRVCVLTEIREVVAAPFSTDLHSSLPYRPSSDSVTIWDDTKLAGFANVSFGNLSTEA